MIKSFAVFLQAAHRAEIVTLAFMSADDGIFLGHVNPADRVAVGLFSGIPTPGMFCHRLFSRSQRDNKAVADVE